jgi:hypothetical protein
MHVMPRLWCGAAISSAQLGGSHVWRKFLVTTNCTNNWKTNAEHHQRPVGEVIQDCLAELVQQQNSVGSPPLPEFAPSVEAMLAALADSEELLRSYDRYYAGLEDEDAP